MKDDRAGDGSRPYVVEVLEALNPSARAVDGKAGESRDRYLVIPSRSRPRLLLPAGHRLAASRAAHRQVSGPGLRTRLLRTCSVLGVATGLADLLAPAVSVVRTDPGAPCAHDVLASLVGRADFVVSMPVSLRRATRKPVLQVTDRRGAPLAFVKVGHDDLTRSLVRREAQALATVGRRTPAELEVPHVLGLEEWQGLSLLGLSPLRPRRSPMGPHRAARALERTAAAISRCGDRGEVDLASTAHVVELRRDLRGCGETGRALLDVVDAAVSRLGRVEVGGWHGDLNPGNLALRRTRAAVWDWERFERAAPLGYDLLHHRLTEQLLAGRPHVDAASSLVAEAERNLRGAQPAGRARDISRMYLCTIAARYLVDRQEAAGSTAGRVSEWVLPAVRRSA